MKRRLVAHPSALFSRLMGISILLLALAPSHSAHAADTASDNLAKLRVLLSQPASTIDLARAKLTIDKMIDPGIDIPAEMARIDGMVVALRKMVPLVASNRVKLEALRRFIYTPGAWNQGRAFSYDLTDPLGRTLRNKLLPTYLDTRKGNCVSMPVLFVILGTRLGLDLRLATAPEHLFVKYRDASGALFNLEATSGGGFARDVWIRKQMPMTDLAIENGIYMRPLSKREAVVVMAGVLLTHYRIEGLADARIELARLLQNVDPRDVRSMLSLRDAYLYMRNTEFVARYPNPNAIPSAERRRFRELEQQVIHWERKARGLGWKAPDEFEG